MNRTQQCIIKPKGKFGIPTPINIMGEYIDTISCTKADVIILDFSDVSFIDSTGISWIVKIHKVCKKKNKYFSIIHTTDTIRDLLGSLYLNNIIPIE
jgi:anti-anti-sigma factor